MIVPYYEWQAKLESGDDWTNQEVEKMFKTLMVTESAIQYPAIHTLIAVLEERKRQDKKWGEQNHDPSMYLTILMEEVGEFAKEVLENKWKWDEIHGGLDLMRNEAIQVAAVALAIVECLDRGKWHWPD